MVSMETVSEKSEPDGPNQDEIRWEQVTKDVESMIAKCKNKNFVE